MAVCIHRYFKVPAPVKQLTAPLHVAMQNSPALYPETFGGLLTPTAIPYTKGFTVHDSASIIVSPEEPRVNWLSGPRFPEYPEIPWILFYQSIKKWYVYKDDYLPVNNEWKEKVPVANP